MKNKKGISLIVLVITILVMLILAGVVIVNMAENNPIEKSREAQFKESLTAIGEELNMFVVNKSAENASFSIDSLFATKDTCTYNTNVDTKNIYGVLPTLKNTKYKNQIEIKRGSLYYKTPNKKEIEWLKDMGIRYTGVVSGTVNIEGDTLLGVSPDYVNTGVLVIPSSVKKIKPGAFANCTDIYEVELQEGITEIPDNCFNNCTNLVRVKLPNTVTRIGVNAFRSCAALVDVNMPNDLVTIAEGAFIYCKKLPSVTFANNLRTIGEKAFKDCLSLNTAKLNKDLNEIQREAFSNSGLANLEVPANVTHIGPNVLYFCQNLETLNVLGINTVVDYSPVRACPKLKSFTIASGNPHNETENNIMYTKEKTVLVSAPSNMPSITVPDTVTTIGEEAFLDATVLTTLDLGKKVTTIGQRAFEGCNTLVNLTIPPSVTTIGKRVLERCNSLTNLKVDNNSKYTAENGVIYEKDSRGNKGKIISAANVNTTFTVPDTVTDIYEDAFAACNNLTSINLNKITNISSQAFRDCKGITNITIPGTCKTVGWGAFTSALNLNTITFAEGVGDIRGAVLRNCENLVNVNMPSTLYAFGGDIFANANKVTNIAFPNGNSKFYTDGKCIYEKLSSGGIMLKAVGGVGSTVKVEKGVTVIAGYSLSSNRTFKKIILPETVTTVEDQAFSWSDNLEEVYISSSVNTIGVDAFTNCPKLGKIYIDKPKGSIQGAPWGATQGEKVLVWK